MQLDRVAAIVTGGGSGLGRATARALAERGVKVVATVRPGRLAHTEQVDGVAYVESDVTDPDQVRYAVDQAANSGVPLRVAINCAGVMPSARILGKRGAHDLNLFRTAVEVNLIGTFNVMTTAVEAIAKTEPLDDETRGAIVNLASAAAFEGQAGQVAYAASKGAVAALTLPAARDLVPHGIRVVTLAPGVIDTPMLSGLTDERRSKLAGQVPFPRRMGRPEECARFMIDIVENDYLNGAVIRFDGALRLS